MSQNKHRSKSLNIGSKTFLSEDLQWPQRTCRRKECNEAAMLPVYARYENRGVIHHEWVCHSCGKVLKDPTKRHLFKKKRFYNKKRKRHNKR